MPGVIRRYCKADEPKLLEILQLNTPKYFAASEENDFREYLQNHLQDYFVIEEQGEIIGAGGTNYIASGEVRISWDLIRPDFQGKGFGKELLAYRLTNIKNDQQANRIIVRTSQLAFKFYKKAGFRLVKQEKDFWAPGFDLYQMELKIE